jgi:hypothetical protein
MKESILWRRRYVHAKHHPRTRQNTGHGPRKPQNVGRGKNKSARTQSLAATSRCGRQKAPRKHHESEHKRTKGVNRRVGHKPTTVPSPHKMERSIVMTCCNVWKIALLKFNVLDFLKNSTGTHARIATSVVKENKSFPSPHYLSFYLR